MSHVTHYDTAKQIMNKYGLQLKCTSLNPIVWYRYESDKWNTVDNNIVKNLIIDEFVENNQHFSNHFSNHFLANVIKECALLAYDTNLTF